MALKTTASLYGLGRTGHVIHMGTKTKAILIGLLFTILGMLLNPNAPLGAAVWGERPASDSAGPSGPQIGLLMLVSLVESVGFGVGAAFLVVGRQSIARVAPSAGWAFAATLIIAWTLMSWVPHSALHQTIGEDYAGLIVIEYLFHVTLIASAVLLVAFFVRTARTLHTTRPGAPGGARSVAVTGGPTPVRRA